jgi:hypothetical protein
MHNYMPDDVIFYVLICNYGLDLVCNISGELYDLKA